jgi:hypothetical protein
VEVGRCRPSAPKLANREIGVPRREASFALNANRLESGANLIRFRGPRNAGETRQTFPKPPFDKLTT